MLSFKQRFVRPFWNGGQSWVRHFGKGEKCTWKGKVSGLNVTLEMKNHTDFKDSTPEFGACCMKLCERVILYDTYIEKLSKEHQEALWYDYYGPMFGIPVVVKDELEEFFHEEHIGVKGNWLTWRRVSDTYKITHFGPFSTSGISGSANPKAGAALKELVSMLPAAKKAAGLPKAVAAFDAGFRSGTNVDSLEMDIQTIRKTFASSIPVEWQTLKYLPEMVSGSSAIMSGKLIDVDIDEVKTDLQVLPNLLHKYHALRYFEYRGLQLNQAFIDIYYHFGYPMQLTSGKCEFNEGVYPGRLGIKYVNSFGGKELELNTDKGLGGDVFLTDGEDVFTFEKMKETKIRIKVNHGPIKLFCRVSPKIAADRSCWWEGECPKLTKK